MWVCVIKHFNKSNHNNKSNNNFYISICGERERKRENTMFWLTIFFYHYFKIFKVLNIELKIFYYQWFNFINIFILLLKQ